MLSIERLELSHYLIQMADNRPFAFAGYSDAEWLSIIGIRLGDQTALGQILDGRHGVRLFNILKRRHADPNFLFAVPDCLLSAPILGSGVIERFLDEVGIDLRAYERDMVTDDLARRAGLFPLIQQLQQHDVVVVGNRHLRRLDFLNYKKFVAIGSPNFHLSHGGIERAADEVLQLSTSAVVLVSAGMSAAAIIDLIYERRKDHFLLDCGSIWDAFVGIGAQRYWRKELYSDRSRLRKWIRANLYGEPYEVKSS